MSIKLINSNIVINDGTNADILKIESSRASSLDATITVLEDV